MAYKRTLTSEILDALAGADDGLTTLEIARKIDAKGFTYSWPSLGPTLSGLHNNGYIWRRDQVWRLLHHKAVGPVSRI